MIFRLYYRVKGGAETSASTVVSFSFFKEAFTPYTQVNVTVFDNNIPDDITEIRLNVNGKVVHHGIVDKCRTVFENGYKKSVISSRGFTVLLTENQLAPGMYTNMSFNRLFDEYFELPYITHEDNSQSSYIYVNKGTPMWDGASNLSYKLTGAYPYIRDANKVMMSMPERAKTFNYQNQKITNYGIELNTTRMVSHYNMADLDDEYDTYSAVSQEAIDRNIIRHRKFQLDRRFLSNPDDACAFRMMMSARGFKRRFFSYNNYLGEDLNDFAIYDTLENRRINAIRITGGKNGVFTELSFYEE